MTTNSILLDPTHELSPALMERLARPKSLEGLTIGLLDISKARGDIFLNHLAKLLRDQGLKVNLYKKPTFARVIPDALAQVLASECDLVIEALAD